MRHVCCFCEHWETGGIESFLCNVLTRLDSSQLQVDIVTAELKESIFTKPLEACGVQFFELSGCQQNIPENHRLFRRLVRQRKYDVIHLNAFHALSLAYLKIAEEEGVAIRIAHSHNTALRKVATRPLKMVVHRWARTRYTKHATALWACSRAAADFLFDGREMSARGFQFIPNGIDVERFRFDPQAREEMRRALGVDGKFVIGHVGRMCYQKNQSFLLDVLAQVIKRRPESLLLLAGEGEDRPMLERRAQSLGLSDRVIFYGVCKRVERLYWAMDVFAFPSAYEGFGIAVIEAQAAGLAVVCSEHVPQEARVTGCMALPLDAQRWAESILSVHSREADGGKVAAAGLHLACVAAQIAEGYASWKD